MLNLNLTQYVPKWNILNKKQYAKNAHCKLKQVDMAVGAKNAPTDLNFRIVQFEFDFKKIK